MHVEYTNKSTVSQVTEAYISDLCIQVYILVFSLCWQNSLARLRMSIARRLNYGATNVRTFHILSLGQICYVT